ncbi:hypothetical protein L6164_000099 [Bauhinia variegata]|uniref:Uncharacterized protein n=1 Tax=Bauhinia variegata TaxID=167791 RepID=A0ACB9Q5K5_BAUVA|nr:hypothetical protein L6164_000099 [Bauhinia variegata]
MEDGVAQDEILLPPLDLDSANESNGGEKPSGSVSNGRSEENKEGEECSENGVVNNLISSLMAPMSFITEQVTEHENGDEASSSERGAETENGGNEGLISNIISNIFHQTDEENRVVEKNEKMETEQESSGNGGGGIIRNLVSHLPPSDQDGAVLTSDEATILINSLVCD